MLILMLDFGNLFVLLSNNFAPWICTHPGEIETESHWIRARTLFLFVFMFYSSAKQYVNLIAKCLRIGNLVTNSSLYQVSIENCVEPRGKYSKVTAGRVYAGSTPVYSRRFVERGRLRRDQLFIDFHCSKALIIRRNPLFEEFRCF